MHQPSTHPIILNHIIDNLFLSSPNGPRYSTVSDNITITATLNPQGAASQLTVTANHADDLTPPVQLIYELTESLFSELTNSDATEIVLDVNYSHIEQQITITANVINYLS